MKFKPGDWVADNLPHQPQIAVVRDAYTTFDGTELLDLFMYDRDGIKLGRVSPNMGGPKTYEPACEARSWFRIARPKFPLSPDGYSEHLVWIDEREPSST